jgi:hypothetical protein
MMNRVSILSGGLLIATLLALPTACARKTAEVSRLRVPWERGSYFPEWRSARSRKVIEFKRDPAKSDEENGARLAEAIKALKPGQEFRIGPGRYSVNRWFDVVLRGTRRKPIRIVAADMKKRPVITRPNAKQNVINIGIKGKSEFLVLRGLEIAGGSTVLKIYQGENVWIDQCLLHGGKAVGLGAHSNDTRLLYITRNEIRNMGKDGGTGEGMYLGNHGGEFGMSYSVVAFNHVHHTAGSQGDGIEVKQNSYNNWIVENHVHDCRYPCIIAYGTGGKGVNLIERNVAYRSGDAVIHVQGDAVIRNNLVFNKGWGFHSKDHVAKSRNLTFVHNTIITEKTGCHLSGWNGREKMVFANNAVYSKTGAAVDFPKGSEGVTFKGNVVVGAVQGIEGGWVKGRGLEDFADVTWDGKKRDATPAKGSVLIGAADPAYAVERDMSDTKRREPPCAGACTSGER